MLKKLVIKNYALIESLEIEPSPGLTIVTGETGAGKSILLGALGLLMGARAESRVLLNENEKCVVEGLFDIGSYALQPLFEELDLDYTVHCTIRREINPAGKSRAFVNDTPVTVDSLKSIVEVLMDVHSQHDTQLLKDTAYQATILDAFASNAAEKEIYQQAFALYQSTERKYRSLLEKSGVLKKESDYDLYIFKELEEAKLVADEQENLETEQSRLENTGEIKEKLQSALQVLSGEEFSILHGLGNLQSLFDQLTPYSETFKTLKDRLASLRIEFKDITAEITKEEEKTETDPERLEWVQQRLSLLYKLQKKHNVLSVNDLLKILASLEEKISSVQTLDEDLFQHQQAVEKAKEQLLSATLLLTESRKRCIPQLETQTLQLLASLGIPFGKLTVQLEPQPPTKDGGDKVTFLFSANKGIPAKELKEVASGGEFSRLMLAIKYQLAEKKAMPTILFDEIDTGISGEIALQTGNMIERMAKHHQVITITHLPQMASQGDTHLYVYKEIGEIRSVSKIKVLSKEERIYEIAQMIGGKNPSESAYQNARELMGNALSS